MAGSKSWLASALWGGIVVALLGAPIAGAGTDSTPAGLSAGDAAEIRSHVEALEARLAGLRRDPHSHADIADAEVFLKAVRWALRYEDRLAPADVTLVKHGLERCEERTTAVESGEVARPWDGKRGRLVRGYRSEVDGSVQPYGLIVPDLYSRRSPIRLDVVLHGSSRPTGLSELRFMAPFDAGDGDSPTPKDQGWIELHPLGRVENCYRWAGETDVFEAIEDVCRHYRIDRSRIVLRGMSMGASGTWHLGLKHPDRFVALGPYCGYVDTHQFSLSPVGGFIPVGPLPEHQELGLHMLDSVDYAANAGAVPVVAAIGEKDPFFQAHVIMGAAFEREGLHMTNLISPGTAHVQDPATHAEQMRRLGEYAARGLDLRPKDLRFVTWTLKYPRCKWLEALALGDHYRRAELHGRLAADGSIAIDGPVNVTRFSVLPIAWSSTSNSSSSSSSTSVARPAKLTIGGQGVRVPSSQTDRPLVFAKRNGRWEYLGHKSDVKLTGKRPGLQGPIDDAFTRPFLCVRGTGTPWNPAVGMWADANLRRFTYEWSRYMRGDLPVKDDTQVTDADLRRFNLVLFGDPGSNRWIAKALPHLPIAWTRGELRMAGQAYPAADHAPVLIQPNPLRGGAGHYLVLNSGHTFHEKELASLNYLLFPRLGDWAVLKVDGKRPSQPSEPLGEEPLRAGFFNEDWRFAAR